LGAHDKGKSASKPPLMFKPRIIEAAAKFTLKDGNVLPRRN
jgi:hypothetical protein